MFIGIGIASVQQFLFSYIRNINLVDAGSFFFLIYAAAMVISRPFTGRWFDKKGENFVIYPSFVLFALGIVILALSKIGFTLLLSATLIGVGYGTFYQVGRLTKSSYVPKIAQVWPHSLILAYWISAPGWARFF